MMIRLNVQLCVCVALSKQKMQTSEQVILMCHTAYGIVNCVHLQMAQVTVLRSSADLIHN